MDRCPIERVEGRSGLPEAGQTPDALLLREGNGRSLPPSFKDVLLKERLFELSGCLETKTPEIRSHATTSGFLDRTGRHS
ncbi:MULTISPECIES: hypothetical protein [Leptospirillum]|uniref:Uncharacterized protein n=2 Tax=Leptospirillum ferriphilum TaxID=178606 RepID=A0A1V3SUA7_9BACT|nr:MULTISPECIES: hypothetical protein [Leptospirillum]AFS53557.1 hypothetical protein LFML04_1332 [Leptospirillum ferriphilum ML-04]AKS23521.1 hypothetical protein ABH19_06795 [Leptospirillum sp. Group II 'CF-1']OOH71191.1 hypothetical protein BOX24_09100 [Leptospirillum ferriphilum]OOH80284.1 hypothetical protein BOX30_06170 [Leptospirillum ferriphilum]